MSDLRTAKLELALAITFFSLPACTRLEKIPITLPVLLLSRARSMLPTLVKHYDEERLAIGCSWGRSF